MSARIYGVGRASKMTEQIDGKEKMISTKQIKKSKIANNRYWTSWKNSSIIIAFTLI